MTVGSRGVSFCVYVYAKTGMCTHTHTNTRKDGSGCRHTGGGTAVHAVLAVSLRLPHSKKFELFLKIVKICYLCCHGGRRT